MWNYRSYHFLTLIRPPNIKGVVYIRVNKLLAPGWEQHRVVMSANQTFSCINVPLEKLKMQLNTDGTVDFLEQGWF